MSLIPLRYALLAILALSCAAPCHSQQPAAWFHFNGNATNYGSARANWRMANTSFVADTLYINGVFTTDPQNHPEGFMAMCWMDDFPRDVFTIGLRFKRDRGTVQNRHLIGGGVSVYWFGLQVGAGGGVELAFNKYRDVVPVPELTLRADDWNWLLCSVDLPQHRCTVSINGRSREVTLPPDLKLDEESKVLKNGSAWTFSNYAKGGAFFGWVDEFIHYERVLTGAEFTALAQRPDLCDATKPVIPRELTVLGRLAPEDLVERKGKLSLSSVGQAISMAGNFDGEYRWNATGVTLQIKRGEIVRQKFGAYPNRHIKGFQFFLGKASTDDKPRTVFAQSEYFPVDTTISHGQSVLLENEVMHIPLKGVPPAEIAQMWLGAFIYDSSGDDPAHYKGGVCGVESPITLEGKPH